MCIVIGLGKSSIQTRRWQKAALWRKRFLDAKLEIIFHAPINSHVYFSYISLVC